MSQVSVMPVERVFRRHPLRIAVSALLFTALLAAIALFALPPMLPVNMPISTRGPIVLAVIVVGTVAIWVGSFWLRNIRVIVRPDSVEIGRPGGTETYARATTGFRSKVTEHRTNGLRSGVTRALLVHTSTREITVELPGFTRSTFNELMAELAPIAAPPVADPVEAARARAHLSSAFTVDATGERRLAQGFLVTAVVAILVTVVVGLFALTPDFFEGEWVALIFIAPMTGLIGIGFAIGAFQRFRTARSVPVQLWVGHQGLRIDQTEYPYAQLTRLWLTPPAYPVQRIRLDRATGRSVTHLLGSSRVRMTPDYAEFLQSLRVETARMPGLISLDLE